VFHERHIPVGIMHRKKQEFLDLQQGTDSVYSKKDWADEKKAELFRKDWAFRFRIA
jgi:hypothetical protein